MSIQIEAPEIVAPGDEVRVRLPGLGSALANLTAYRLSPLGYEINVTAFLRALPGPVITGYELIVTLTDAGNHLIKITDSTGTGDTGYKQITAAVWASRIDANISDIMRQRVEVERLRGVIRTEVRRNG